MDKYGGAWPTMATPYDHTLNIDVGAYRAMVDWYVERSVGGVYANCLTSEMYQLTPDERIGDYGGNMRIFTNRAQLTWADAAPAQNQQLLRIDPDLRDAVPNMLSAWEVSPDSTEFTCRMRKGLRFSDSEPATADDVMFWYNDLERHNGFKQSRFGLGKRVDEGLGAGHLKGNR